METVLIAAGNEKTLQALPELIRSAYRHVAADAVTNGAAARRLLLERAYDVMVVAMPLADETGTELAAQAAEESGMGVILLAKAESAEEIAAWVEDAGVFVVERPIHKPFFFRALRLVDTAGRRMRGLEREKEALRARMEDIRVVDRAKCALMECLSMTEAQAHRQIEKRAMDERLPKRQIAESILKRYAQNNNG